MKKLILTLCLLLISSISFATPSPDLWAYAGKLEDNTLYYSKQPPKMLEYDGNHIVAIGNLYYEKADGSFAVYNVQTYADKNIYKIKYLSAVSYNADGTIKERYSSDNWRPVIPQTLDFFLSLVNTSVALQQFKK